MQQQEQQEQQKQKQKSKSNKHVNNVYANGVPSVESLRDLEFKVCVENGRFWKNWRNWKLCPTENALSKREIFKLPRTTDGYVLIGQTSDGYDEYAYPEYGPYQFGGYCKVTISYGDFHGYGKYNFRWNQNFDRHLGISEALGKAMRSMAD